MKKFTLVELLLTIAMISILASLLLPALGKAKMKTMQIACANNIKNLSVGFAAYVGDSGDYIMPISSGGVYTWQTYLILYGGIPDYKLFKCPADANPSNPSGVTSRAPCTAPPYTYQNSYGANSQFVRQGQKSFAKASKLTTTIVILDANYNLVQNSAVGYNVNFRWIADNCRSIRHFEGVNILFADLHVARTIASGIPESNWHADMWWCKDLQ